MNFKFVAVEISSLPNSKWSLMLNRADDPRLSERLAQIYTSLSDIEADRAPAKAAVILHGLGFTPDMQVRFL